MSDQKTGSQPAEGEARRRRISAVVLDVDGTVASCPIDFGAMRAEVARIAATWGFDLSKLGARGVIEQIELAAAALHECGEGFRREAEQAVRAIETEAAAGARPLPGAAEALAQLRQQGLAIALITRNCRAAAELVLREVSAYDVLLTRDDVPRPKPDPDHVHRSLAAVGCRAEHAAMVGDHAYDMRAGKAAGTCLCVGVRTGNSSDQSLREAGADVVIDSIADLPACLARDGG